MKSFKSFLIEIHSKDQSLMNQRYSWENVIYLRKEKFTSITFKAEVFQSVKTKDNYCNEENSLKITNCYDKFYMLKLNCSFPWLKNIPRAPHIIGSASWPKIKNLQYHLSGVVEDLLGIHFLPMGK